jgi:integrase
MARTKGKTLSLVCEEYYKSLDYKSLTPITQRDYKYCLNALLGIQHGRIKFASANLQTIRPPNAQYAYNQWAERGVPWANHCQAVASKLWNWAISLGYSSEVNPFSKVSRRPHRPRKVVWSREDVTRFLDTAYSRFQWRSVGLIVQMAYEWCQRLGDMANLTWDKYDFDARVLKLEQSKRRARVELPTSDDLHETLMRQHAELGHQPYVCPKVYFNTIIGLQPYNKYDLQFVARTIMDAAGLPKEYQIMDMRRTGTVEMVDAGVPLAQIMSVTGHQSPQSVAPYLKNTLSSASSALSKRNEFKFDRSANA